MRLLAAALLTLTMAGAAQGQARKRLIEFGWDLPSPATVNARSREMEARPFDGVVVQPSGGKALFLRTPLDAARLQSDAELLRATGFREFRHNFLLTWATCDEGYDWTRDADWQIAEANTRALARTARAGRFVGLVFDPEPYGGNPWRYDKQPGCKRLTFAQLARVVRRRGADWMRTVQAEIPDPRILTFFHASFFSKILDDPSPVSRQQRLAEQDWGLLPAFLDGLLDAAAPGTVIIDGNETSYYHRGTAGYFEAYHRIHSSAMALVDPRNHGKYRQNVQAGNALYMDLTFALSPYKTPGTSMTPQERARWFEHNVYYSLYTSDEYVWCFSERMGWWAGQIPPGAEEAIRAARSKIDAGQPLGFTVEDLVASASRR